MVLDRFGEFLELEQLPGELLQQVACLGGGGVEELAAQDDPVHSAAGQAPVHLGLDGDGVPAVDQRDALAAQLAGAKVIATNNAIEITDLAMRVVGSVGMQKSHPLERYFRDVRAGLGNPPIDDVALGLLARTTLGL